MTEIQLLDKKTSLEHPGSISIKIIVLWILGIAAAFAFGWFLKDFFRTTDWNALFWASVLGLVFSIIFLLQTFFTRQNSASAFILVLESLAMVITFITESLVILSFSVIIFAVLYWGNYSGRKVLENNMKINFWETSRAVLPKAVAAFALLFGGLMPFYSAVADQDRFPVSPFLFREVMSSGDFIINKFLPGFTISSTLEEIALKTSEQSLNRLPGAENLSKTAKQQIIGKSASEFYDRVSSFLGIKINPKMNIPDSLYQIAREKFLNLSERGKQIVFAIIGLLIFLTIEAISWPLRSVISILTFVIYEILLAIGFARISLEQRSKETIIV
ncbi:MAG: hypothetical protein AAB757_01055 [Patescibacteria group bacterium]